jgi:hypothetical protein
MEKKELALLHKHHAFLYYPCPNHSLTAIQSELDPTHNQGGAPSRNDTQYEPDTSPHYMLDNSDPGGDTSNESDTSPNTFYKAYTKPECDESNAESASRSRLIQQRIIRLLKRHKKTYSNNVSNFELQLDFPETHQNHPRTPPTHIDVLFDTGASITMLPGQFTFAWTNVRPSFNTIRGCFKGNDTHDSQIGEFHALLTLSSTEAIRVVITEAILLPPEVANNYLLANIPFLMAEHQVHCDLHKPKLVFNGGGQYVMDFKRAHYVIKLLPVAAHPTTLAPNHNLTPTTSLRPSHLR